jgi:hypothetical protein
VRPHPPVHGGSSSTLLVRSRTVSTGDPQTRNHALSGVTQVTHAGLEPPTNWLRARLRIVQGRIWRARPSALATVGDFLAQFWPSGAWILSQLQYKCSTDEAIPNDSDNPAVAFSAGVG